MSNIQHSISKGEISAQNFIIGHSLLDIGYSYAFASVFAPPDLGARGAAGLGIFLAWNLWIPGLEPMEMEDGKKEERGKRLGHVGGAGCGLHGLKGGIAARAAGAVRIAPA